MTLRHRVHKVVYVPLDDRPCNIKHVRMLAEIVDYDLSIPPLDMLGRFTAPGQPEEIITWLEDEAESNPDCIILALDMLAYGGLVASRSPAIRTQLALQRLDCLKEIRKRAGDTPIFASNIVMRLSITASNDQSALYWNTLRRYSELSGLLEETGRETYRNELERIKRELPTELLGQYLACRERNLQVNMRAVEEVDKGNIDFLVLPQEDAAVHGMHRKEQGILHDSIARRSLEDKVLIYPGADETGATLFARFVHKHMEKVPRIFVLPSSAVSMNNVAMFEDRPFSETLAANINVIGAERTESLEDADLVLAVNAPQKHSRAYYAEDERRSARRKRLEQFAARIGKLNHQGLTICDAAFANGAEDDFVTALLDQGIELHTLLGFAGWNTAGNSLGSSLAQGTLRLIAMQDKGAFDLANIVVSLTPLRYLELLNSLIASEKAHAGLLFYHLVDDWQYQSLVRPHVTDLVINLLEASIFDLGTGYKQAEQIVRDELTHAATDLWIEQFLGRVSIEIGPDEARSALVLADLEETRVRLPWRRLFEVDMDFDFGVQLVADELQQ